MVQTVCICVCVWDDDGDDDGGIPQLLLRSAAVSSSIKDIQHMLPARLAFLGMSSHLPITQPCFVGFVFPT